MYWTLGLGLVALIVEHVAALNEGVYRDPDTGLTFYQSYQPYTLDSGRGITFRAAIPDAAQYSTFDAVIQLIIPTEVGWAGVAWGGSMSQNPLLVVWRSSNNQDAVASSRWSNSHTTPTPYTGATYTVYRTGTKSNSTHWQVTIKCTGCSSWRNLSGAARYINPRGNNRLGWAYSRTRPSNPSSTSSSISIHDLPGYVTLNFAQGINTNFDELVQSLQ
ncbi:Cellobiose dehydrogenase [Madurella mycetomatis]|uniref:Cellobiose dehydrogenase n=1 Tax=Madurella mycetomatis TaxID=100816 RepID=A0A175WCA8_9PEZI|nr:Cellobiose dehydrogenase [Madurella mycetomatis]